MFAVVLAYYRGNRQQLQAKLLAKCKLIRQKGRYQMTLRKLIQQAMAGLTVYSADAGQSQLWGHLDQLIHEKTDLVPIFRQWIYHDVASITRFYGGEVTEEIRRKTIHDYDNIPLNDIQYGHFVVKLFIIGASLVTIWQGENAIEKLLVAKGTTHPAESPRETVRGGLWCDNSVCNLLHSSDNQEEILRELDALNLNSISDKVLNPMQLIPKNTLPANYRAHSSIVIALHTLNRWLFTQAEGRQIEFQLPISGDATETMHNLSIVLKDAISDYPNTIISDFVQAYFDGDLVAITPLLRRLPLTSWEQFVVQCGTLTRKQWDESKRL